MYYIWFDLAVWRETWLPTSHKHNENQYTARNTPPTSFTTLYYTRTFYPVLDYSKLITFYHMCYYFTINYILSYVLSHSWLFLDELYYTRTFYPVLDYLQSITLYHMCYPEVDYFTINYILSYVLSHTCLFLNELNLNNMCYCFLHKNSASKLSHHNFWL